MQLFDACLPFLHVMTLSWFGKGKGKRKDFIPKDRYMKGEIEQSICPKKPFKFIFSFAKLILLSIQEWW